MKKGIVLEGGAMRGMFTSGILDVLMENGVEFDGAVGVSAGMTFGCNLKSKQIGRAIRYNLKYANDPRYGTFKSWLKTGNIYEADFCYNQLPFELDKFDTETFRKNPMEFYCVVTDAMTGKPVYHKCTTGTKRDMAYIRASASIPVVSKMVKIGDGYYCDGGAADSIPLKFMEGKGYDKNVVVLTRDRSYRKKPGKLDAVYKVLLCNYPGAAKALINRAEMYNKQREYVEAKEAAGEIFVFYPPEELTISRTEHDPEKLQQVYDMGRAEAVKRLDELKEFLDHKIKKFAE